MDYLKFALLDKVHRKGDNPENHLGKHKVPLNDGGNGYKDVVVVITSDDVRKYRAEKAAYYPH